MHNVARAVFIAWRFSRKKKNWESSLQFSGSTLKIDINVKTFISPFCWIMDILLQVFKVL